MESKLKSNINTVGLVGYILSIILIVGVIAAMVANAIGIAAASSVSKENVNVDMKYDITVSSSGDILSILDNFVGIDGVDELSDLAEDPDIEINDADISDINITKNGDGYVIDLKTDEVTFSGSRLIVTLVVSFIYLASIAVALYMLKALMKELKNCDSPFGEGVVKRMNNFAYSLIPYAVLSMINDSFWGQFMVGGELNFSINISKVILVVFVFVLCMIFKYGAELQRQSDETL